MAWNPDQQIVAGERIGGFVLGKSADEVLPAERGVDTGIAEYAMRHQVQVQVHRNRIIELATGSNRYVTDEGFRVGGDFGAVVAAWGDPLDRAELEGGQMFDFKAAYPEKGMDFAVKDGRILYIGIFAREGPAAG